MGQERPVGDSRVAGNRRFYSRAALALSGFSLIASPSSVLAHEWSLQRGADSFTDQKMVVATRSFATSDFTGTASIACTGGKKLTYGVNIQKALGTTNVYIDRGIDPAGAGMAIETGGLVGYAGPVATIDVRTDGSDIKHLNVPIRYSNAIILSSSDFRADLNAWIASVGQSIADMRLGVAKSVSTPAGIADLAAANRIRMRIHVQNGDIIFDLNQSEAEPTAVLAMCGLVRPNLTKALNDEAASDIRLSRDAEVLNEGQ